MFINRKLIEFAKESRRLFVAVGALETIAVLMASLITLLSSIVVRMILGGEDVLLFTDIWQPFVLIILIIAFRFLLSKARTVKSLKCSVEIKGNLRVKLMKKLLELGPGYTVGQRTGEIVSTIWSKVEWLNNYYSKYIPATIAAMANAVVVLAVVFVFDWVVGGVALLAAVGVLVCPALFYKIMQKHGHAEWDASSKYYSDCLDGIQGVSNLKAFNANSYQCEKIHRQGETLRKSIMKHLNVTIMENCVLELFAWLGSAITVVVAAFRFLDGAIQADSLIYILFLAGACFKPMFNMITAWHMGYRGATGSESIAAMLEEKADISLLSCLGENDSFTADSSFGSNREIKFENVTFAYNKNDGNVLNSISIDIPGGTTTALVGSSGGGKSTIAHMLAGFYRPQLGSISIDRNELNENSVAKIQSLIAAVWQDSYIFYGSCMDNIRMGRPSASLTEVIEAAKAANIHDFIENMENGYNTMLGERGTRLSGGERQCIAIARAFLRDAPIVIFDEATSALDRSNEKAIQSAFAALKKGKTVLVIAHRLNTIQDADQICVIDRGTIAAAGTHRDLETSSKIYKRLMANQLETGKEV